MLSDIFQRFAEQHPTAFTPDALAPLHAHFGHWPEAGLSALGFEMRLDDDLTVDLSGLITDPHAAQSALGPVLAPGWHPLLTLLSAWETRWRDQFYNLWFEFDAMQTRPMPAVFLQRCMPKPKPKGSLAETFAALALVAGPVDPRFVSATTQADEHVCYVGALLSRADGLYRLALPATLANMEEILTLLGWQGSAAALHALLRELAPLHTRSYGLDVDWNGGALLPKIGIDIVMPDLVKMWPWLEARGLVSSRLAGGRDQLRAVSHFKLVFSGERIVHAKAYLRYNFPHASRHRM